VQLGVVLQPPERRPPKDHPSQQPPPRSCGQLTPRLNSLVALNEPWAKLSTPDGVRPSLTSPPPSLRSGFRSAKKGTSLQQRTTAGVEEVAGEDRRCQGMGHGSGEAGSLDRFTSLRAHFERGALHRKRGNLLKRPRCAVASDAGTRLPLEKRLPLYRGVVYIVCRSS
jgi:hypothetical protein